jgi:hypothetical protein
MTPVKAIWGKLRAILTDENVDLWLLTAAAAVFTILGIVDVASMNVLSSTILALLAVLAFAQIRSRKLVEQIAVANRSESAVRLTREFPEELGRRRAEATDVLLIGIAMARTIQGARDEFYSSLQRGARIRVLVLDPSDESLLSQAARLRPPGRASLLAQRIRTTLDELAELKQSTNGNLEVRVAQFVPSTGVNLLRGIRPALMTIQHTEFAPEGEPGPILQFTEADGWFSFYEQQAERMWAAGSPWPPSLDHRLASAPRPQFADDFGPEFLQAVKSAEDLFITGVTRNALFDRNFTVFQQLLQGGCRVRVLLMAPDAAAVGVAAERSYAARDAGSTVTRIEHSLQMLTKLGQATKGDLEVRLTGYPLATGLVGVNLPGSAGRSSALFVEYYTFHAGRGVEPKFVLQPGEAGFDKFLGEAENLWAAAVPDAGDQADGSSPGVTRPHS